MSDKCKTCGLADYDTEGRCPRCYERRSELAAPAGSVKPGVVVQFGNENGLMGPDYAVIELRNGLVLEVGDEGICVHRSLQHRQNGHPPLQGLTFSLNAADDRRGASGSSAG